MNLRRFLLVTVNKTEARSTLDVFSKAIGIPWGRKVFNRRTYIYLGQISEFEIYMIRSEMGISGPSSSQLTISRAIDDLAPEAILMLGVAFGIDPKKQEIGDILISTQLMGYEAAKIKEKQIQRGDKPSSSPDLLAMFRNGEIDWNGAELHFGLVLSGEKLVADQEFRDWLISIEPEAIGGEMEGVGLYAAAHGRKVDWILVKGICDWADGDKNDEYQALAALNAAKFTVHVIQSYRIAKESHTITGNQELFSDRDEYFQYQKNLLDQIQDFFVYQLQKELTNKMDKYFPLPESELKKSKNYLAILYFSQEKKEIKRITKELRVLYLQKPEYLSDDSLQLIKNRVNNVEAHTRLTLDLIDATLSKAYHPLGQSVQNASRKVLDHAEAISVAIIRNQVNQMWSSLLSLRLEMEIYETCLNEINDYLQETLKK